MEVSGNKDHRTVEIEKQIEEVNAEIVEKNNAIVKIGKSDIPGIQAEIEELKNKEEETRIMAEEGFIGSDFNWVKTILFTLFAMVLGLSLVFFYTSLVYNAVIKDLFSQKQQYYSGNSSTLFNTLLDIKSLFTLNTAIVISYLSSALFLSIGLLLHNDSVFHGNKFVKGFTKFLLVMITLGMEVVFAYKIEKNIDELKVITVMDYKPAENWLDLILSVDVLIVISLGFVAYIIWSFVLEGAFNEWDKRNPKKLAGLVIKEIQKKINRRKYKIGEFNKQKALLEGERNSLSAALEVLHKKANMVFFKPAELHHRLDEFFSGWLFYVNSNDGLKGSVEPHQLEFIRIKEELINSQNN
jgi:hypothetical protein